MEKGHTARVERPRGRPRAFNRDDALIKAMRLFWARGYEGVTVQEVADELGINPPSLYAAFGDKRQLYRESIQRYLTGPGAYAVAALAHLDIGQAIEELLIGAVHTLTSPETPSGCMVVLSALNLGVNSADIETELAGMRRHFQEAVRKRLQEAKQNGQLRTQTDVATLARSIIVTYQGIAISARDGESRANLEAVVRLQLSALSIDHI